MLQIMFPHKFDRYRMMGYIMRQLRESKNLSQPDLGELIETRLHPTAAATQTPRSTLQRRISQIENFNHLEKAAAHGQRPVAREVFVRTASEGLGLSQIDADALLWLIEGKDFHALNHEELISHPSFVATQPNEYSADDLRRHSLDLLERAVKLAHVGEDTRVRMLTGWEEGHQVTFRQKLLLMEERPGQRLLISKYPSLLTYPGNVFDHIDAATERNLSVPAQHKLSELTTRRRQVFRETLRQYGERCIHSVPSLKRYLSKGFTHSLPLEERRKHVGNLVRLLRENEYFEVALASAEPEMEFVIKSGQMASLRGTARDVRHSPGSVICGPLYIFWDNFTTVYSFMVDFEYAWDKIPREQRETKKVANQLEALLAH